MAKQLFTLYIRNKAHHSGTRFIPAGEWKIYDTKSIGGISNARAHFSKLLLDYQRGKYPGKEARLRVVGS